MNDFNKEMPRENKKQNERNLLDLFSGGCEMGERIRTFDWSRTSLGPIEMWPENLKVSVNTMLRARACIGIYWGTDLILLYNDAWKELIGEKHPLALGCPARIVFSEIWDSLEPLFASAMSGTATEQIEQLLPINRNGPIKNAWFDYSFNPILSKEGRTVGVFNIAVESTTERVISRAEIEESQRRLRALSAKLVQTVEIEQQRMAFFLHDEIQQTLTAVKIHLELIKNELSDKRSANDGMIATIDQCQNLISQAINSCRSTALELHPPDKDHRDLASALELLLSWLQKQFLIKVDLWVDKQIKTITEEIRLMIFRAVQELVLNVIKHAGISDINMNLIQTEDGFIELSVEDKGRGFNSNLFWESFAQIPKPSFGLYSLSEQARNLGGNLALESRSGAGTRVTLRLPSAPGRK